MRKYRILEALHMSLHNVLTFELLSDTYYFFVKKDSLIL